MPTSTETTPARPTRIGRHYGCLVAVLYLSVLAASVPFALRRPLPGLALVAGLLALGWWLLRRSARREREAAAREVARLRAVAPPAGDAWRELLAHEGLGRLVEGLAARVRPALRITTRAQPCATALGRSRIGGAPDLPADLAWPLHDEMPMLFLAQIELAEVQCALPGNPLPEGGHLWFFYSQTQPWGFDPKDAGACRLFYRGPGTPLVPAAPPEELPTEDLFRACEVAFEAYESLPDLDEQGDEHELDDDETDRYLGLRDYLASGGGGPCHKLLGHADPVQGPMELECQLVTHGIDCGSPSGYQDPRAAALASGQAEWRLLLQLDSDDAAEMTWGDAGRLYVWIREQDLRARRFEKAWLILQCT
jgi:uncharacterized protein YwqG